MRNRWHALSRDLHCGFARMDATSLAKIASQLSSMWHRPGRLSYHLSHARRVGPRVHKCSTLYKNSHSECVRAA